MAFDLAPAASGNPHRTLEERDRQSFVRRGLEMLPDKLREAVILRDLQGLTYQEMADRLLSSIPHASLVTIPGAYHHLTLDNPAEFTAALSTFLATL